MFFNELPQPLFAFISLHKKAFSKNATRIEESSSVARLPKILSRIIEFFSGDHLYLGRALQLLSHKPRPFIPSQFFNDKCMLRKELQ